MHRSVSVTVTLLMTWACGSDPKPPPAAPGGETTAPVAGPTVAPPTTGDDGKDPNKGQISISEEIRRACGISSEEAFFAYDSADVRMADHPTLTKLATCFISGAMSGRNMRLVGHADPRGDEEYNLALGGKRAEAVKGFLVKKGLGDGRVETSSRGEMDATGTDDDGWFKDRRVDVLATP